MNYEIDITNTSFLSAQTAPEVIRWGHQDFHRAAQAADCDGVAYDTIRLPRMLAERLTHQTRKIDHGVKQLRRSWRQEDTLWQAAIDTGRWQWSVPTYFLFPHQRNTRTLEIIQKQFGKKFPLSDYPAYAQMDAATGEFPQVMVHIDKWTMQYFGASTVEELLLRLRHNKINGIIDLATIGTTQEIQGGNWRKAVTDALIFGNVQDIHIPAYRDDHPEMHPVLDQFIEHRQGQIRYALNMARMLGKQNLRITIEGSPTGVINLGSQEVSGGTRVEKLTAGYRKIVNQVRQSLAERH